MKLAILEYEILFDPTEAWTSGYEFESALADFFAAHGFEAQIIDTRGGTSKRVILLSKIEQPPEPPAPPEVNIRDQVKKLQQVQPKIKQFNPNNQKNPDYRKGK